VPELKYFVMSSISRTITGLTRETVGRPSHTIPLPGNLGSTGRLKYVISVLLSERGVTAGVKAEFLIYDSGARRISDRNAVIEGDEEG
jgi:hypothetical protein